MTVISVTAFSRTKLWFFMNLCAANVRPIPCTHAHSPHSLSEQLKFNLQSYVNWMIHSLLFFLVRYICFIFMVKIQAHSESCFSLWLLLSFFRWFYASDERLRLCFIGMKILFYGCVDCSGMRLMRILLFMSTYTHLMCADGALGIRNFWDSLYQL